MPPPAGSLRHGYQATSSAIVACTPIAACSRCSKALAKAIRDVFGGRALNQRCQAHKVRNVLDATTAVAPRRRSA